MQMARVGRKQGLLKKLEDWEWWQKNRKHKAGEVGGNIFNHSKDLDITQRHWSVLSRGKYRSLGSSLGLKYGECWKRSTSRGREMHQEAMLSG